MSGKYKLTYFQMKGRGEGIRIMLAAAGLDFEDDRVTGEQWMAIKEKTPGNQLPVLTTPDGRVLRQSMAIMRYIAHKHGLYPTDPEDVYKTEMAYGTLEDLFMELFKVMTSKTDEDKAAIVKNLMEQRGPQVCTQLIEQLDASKTGFITGSAKPNFADFAFVWIIDLITDNFGDLIKKFPKLTAHKDKVIKAVPKLEA